VKVTVALSSAASAVATDRWYAYTPSFPQAT
jgi:hypothetical protein